MTRICVSSVRAVDIAKALSAALLQAQGADEPLPIIAARDQMPTMAERFASIDEAFGAGAAARVTQPR